MHNAYVHTDGLASVANVSALMLYPFHGNKFGETLRLLVARQNSFPHVESHAFTYIMQDSNSIRYELS